jgi:3-oxoadipate enol-lactonase/4-carboxymuconolactone decarboxylase
MLHLALNGVDFRYELSGPELAPLVVFADPLGDMEDTWDAQLAALRGRYRCLRYDSPGRSRSTTHDRPVGSAKLAEDLGSLLDALGLARFHLFGLGIGGGTALVFAFRHPERLHSLVLVPGEAIPEMDLRSGAASITVPALVIIGADHRPPVDHVGEEVRG